VQALALEVYRMRKLGTQSLDNPEKDERFSQEIGTR